MSLFRGIDTSASALTANRLWMDTIASNVANANTTRGKFVNGAWQPYRRKMVELSPRTGESFDNLLQAAVGNVAGRQESGVHVTAIKEDNSPFQRVYDPEHPDADLDGYVLMPNVNKVKEMIDMISASRSYEANVTVMNALKGMMQKALEINGK
ncbi:flagellar basal body rod protein FlgC [Brevibacillus laterosporus]|uniref:flagellar basal body rod protein FlgC n=1 Tax=Brevibacillus laterosporus TaxID=1465 RepID=UPI000839D150|nr:flagellar basal body rod protein FlgC [Brevibacillus laterosporus]